MPAYSVGNAIAIYPGQQIAMFNAEVPTAGVASQAIARTNIPGAGVNPITFAVSFAAAPTVSLQLQGSMVDVAASYMSIGSPITTQTDFVTDSNNFAFYRWLPVTFSAGGALTAIARG